MGIAIWPEVDLGRENSPRRLIHKPDRRRETEPSLIPYVTRRPYLTAFPATFLEVSGKPQQNLER